MMLWIFAHWKLIAASLITAALVSFAAFIHATLREADHKREMLAQKEVLTAECMRAQDITRKANEQIVKDAVTRNERANSIKLRRKEAVENYLSAKANDQSPWTGTVRDIGITDEWLIDFTRDHCSRYRDERIVLDQYIEEVEQFLEQRKEAD
jgi:hypothetical protein